MKKRTLSALWTREKLRRASRLRERRGSKREPVDRNRLRGTAATSTPRRSGDLTRPQEESTLFAACWTPAATRARETAHPGRRSRDGDISGTWWRHHGLHGLLTETARYDGRCARGELPAAGSSDLAAGPRAPRTRASAGSFAGATDTARRCHDDPHGWTRQGRDGDRDRTCLHGLGRTSREPATRRTPWSAAGCNRPAAHCVAQAAEVVRNGKGGTGLEARQLRAEGAQRSRAAHLGESDVHLGGHLVRTGTAASWEWTHSGYVDGGAIFENTMRGVRQDSTWQAACGRPRSTPVGKEHFFGSASERRTSGERRVDDAQDHRSRPLLRQEGRAEGTWNTASWTTRRARTRSFGSRNEAPAQRLLPREHGVFGHCVPRHCAAGMARPPCNLWMRRDRPCTLTDGTFGDRWVGGGDDRVHAGSEGQEGSTHRRHTAGRAKGRAVKTNGTGDSAAKVKTESGEGQRPAAQQRAPGSSPR